MRKQGYTAIAMLVLLGCLAVSASAQCSSLHKRVNIPFQFNVAETTLSPGEYAMTCKNGQLLIRSLDKKALARVAMIPVTGKAQDHGYLLFRRYGSHYFFAQAWMGGMEHGLENPRSQAERVVARNFGGVKPKSDEIVLRLRQ